MFKNKILDIKTEITDEVIKQLKSEPIFSPVPNSNVEFIVPLFDAREHYKHLKKQIWKFSRKY